MLDLKTLLAYHAHRLWRRRWSVMAVAWGLCLLGWLAVAALPSKYGSHAQIYVDTDTVLKPLLGSMAVQPDVSSNIEVVRRTLLSPESLTDAVRALGDAGPPNRILKEATEISRAVTLRADRNARNLYTVSYRARDPHRAQEVVEQIVQLFIRRTRNIGKDAVTSARAFIEGEIATYKRRLGEAERKLAAFQREHATELAAVSAQAFAQQEESAQAEISRLSATYESKVWQRDQLRADLARTPATLSAAQAAALAPLSPEQQRLETLKAKLAAMKQIYKDNYPDIVALKREIAAVEANPAARTLRGSGASHAERDDVGRAPNPAYRSLQDELRRVEAEIVAADRQIAAQRARLKELRRQRAGVPQVEQQLAALNRDYGVLKKNYAALIERRESANMTQNIEAQGSSVAFRVIEKPSFSAVPVWPPRNLLYPAVAALAIAAGLGLAFLRYYFMSGEIVTAGELRAAAPDIAVLGVLRRAPSPGGPGQALGTSLFVALALLLGVATVAASLATLHLHDAYSPYMMVHEAWWSLNRMLR